MSNIFEAFNKIADKKILEAMDSGEFDDLPGKGKPLRLEDDRHIPADIRLAHKILKNADCLPPELELRKEIFTVEELLAGEKDAKEKYRQIKRLNYLVMKLNMTRRGSFSLEKNQIYYERLVDKMGKEKEEAKK
ncbi:MAG: DnaJ family domain-containing protein [Syntrophobacteraceae bacterium]